MYKNRPIFLRSLTVSNCTISTKTFCCLQWFPAMHTSSPWTPGAPKPYLCTLSSYQVVGLATSDPCLLSTQLPKAGHNVNGINSASTSPFLQQVPGTLQSSLSHTSPLNHCSGPSSPLQCWVCQLKFHTLNCQYNNVDLQWSRGHVERLRGSTGWQCHKPYHHEGGSFWRLKVNVIVFLLYTLGSCTTR